MRRNKLTVSNQHISYMAHVQLGPHKQLKWRTLQQQLTGFNR